MAPSGIPDNQVATIVAYLRSMTAGNGDASGGEDFVLRDLILPRERDGSDAQSERIGRGVTQIAQLFCNHRTKIAADNAVARAREQKQRRRRNAQSMRDPQVD